MSDIGTPMTSTIPTVGSSGTAYATSINTFLDEVKTRLEAEIPITSLQITTLDMANNPIQNLQYASLYETTVTPSSPVGALYNYGGDVWWVSPAGAVQITDGAAVNAAGIGGITGDYGGANPAQFRFVDADQEYYAYDNFGTGAWARVWARNFDIAGGASSAFRVRLAFGGVANYTCTFPAAVPASTSLLRMDTSGNILTTGNPLGVTFSANEHVEISGSGRYKHGSKTYSQSPLATNTVVTAGSLTPAVASNAITATIAVSSIVYFPLDLNFDWRINSVTIYGTTTSEPTIQFYDIDGVNKATTVTGGPMTATGLQVHTFNTPYTANLPLTLKLTAGAGAALTLKEFDISYDVP